MTRFFKKKFIGLWWWAHHVPDYSSRVTHTLVSMDSDSHCDRQAKKTDHNWWRKSIEQVVSEFPSSVKKGFCSRIKKVTSGRKETCHRSLHIRILSCREGMNRKESCRFTESLRKKLSSRSWMTVYERYTRSRRRLKKLRSKENRKSHKNQEDTHSHKKIIVTFFWFRLTIERESHCCTMSC